MHSKKKCIAKLKWPIIWDEASIILFESWILIRWTGCRIVRHCSYWPHIKAPCALYVYIHCCHNKEKILTIVSFPQHTMFFFVFLFFFFLEGGGATIQIHCFTAKHWMMVMPYIFVELYPKNDYIHLMKMMWQVHGKLYSYTRTHTLIQQLAR